MGIRQFHFPNLPGVQEAHALLDRIAGQPWCDPARTVDRPLVLYGAGQLGRIAWEYFAALGIPVTAVVDANPERAPEFWLGKPLYGLADAPPHLKSEAQLAVCVTTQPYGRIVPPLVSAGWRSPVPLYSVMAAYADRHPFSNGWFAGPLVAEDVAGMAAALGSYADDLSRAHHLQFAAWHVLEQEWSFAGAPVSSADGYFIPEIRAVLHDHEDFLDVGAHDGEVSLRFAETVGGRFRSVTAVEPDSSNLVRLEQNLCERGDDRYRVIAVALGLVDGTAPFHGGYDFASRLGPRGGHWVPLRRLDSLGLSPSFIKVHVEGSELDVLLGGLESIRRCRPVIAVSVYHSDDGLWRTPLRLTNELASLGYVSLFRLHSWYGSGANLYLLPAERL